jgi:hypothetical protein
MANQALADLFKTLVTATQNCGSRLEQTAIYSIAFLRSADDLLQMLLNEANLTTCGCSALKRSGR